jgi:hypothetical protein
MIASHYPRAAIVSCTPLCGDRSNGMLMSSLFRGWPKDRLSQIYFRQLAKHRPHFDICDDFSAIELSGRVRHSAYLQEPEGDSKEQNSAENPSLIRRAMQSPTIYRGMKFMQECWQAHSWIAKSLVSELKSRQPDVVYALLGNYGLTQIITDACCRLSIPYFIHITDDFAQGLYASPPLSLLQQRVDRALRRAIRHASGCAAISPAMAQAFEQRYDVPWSWFTTLVSAGHYDPTPQLVPRRLHCVYTGNLGIGRHETLHQLSQALRLLRDQDGIDGRLTIYSTPDQIADYGKGLGDPEITVLGGWARPDELPKIFHHADVLVHAESFVPSTVELVRYSLSTKLSQYMMSGRCVLALGPEEVSSVRLPAEVGGGVAVHSQDPQTIAGAIRLRLLAPESRQQFGTTGRRWAQTWVEQSQGHERFRETLMPSRR